MSPRAFPRAPRRGPQRKTLWLDFAQVLTGKTTVAAATAVALSQLNAAALAIRPFTVVRTRGLLWVSSDQASAVEEPFGALGFAVVSEQATAVGVTALPTPITEAGSSMFFSWTPWYASINVLSGVGAQNISNVYEFDSKAMRKVEVGEDISMTIENGNANDGASIIAMARILIKTH